jgi:hypothetical protein
LTPKFVGTLSWVYTGGPEGARAVLSTVAGSMIAVAGVTFSITIVSLTLESQQFGPRLLRNFLRDLGNQIVLGTFVSTFLYCLLVLRTVRPGRLSGSTNPPVRPDPGRPERRRRRAGRVEMRGQPRQHALRRGAIAVTHAVEGQTNRGLDGTLTERVRSKPALGQPQHGAAAILRIVDPLHQLLPDQSLQHTGERARMQVQNRRQIAGRHPGKQPDHAEGETLWPGDPDLAGHSLRCSLQAVRHGPQQLHELKHIR